MKRLSEMSQLDPLVGVWKLEASFPGAPPGRVVFEWMTGKQFLIQRWEVPVPEAPDGLAIIGANPEEPGFMQHYFDSRGVARIYRMTFENGQWALWRDVPDFSPLDFKQRFSATLSSDGTTIRGRWDISHDGSTWEPDFDLTYTKLH